MAGFDVVVVGGGVVGLSLAWRLRQQGASVAVLERDTFLRDGDDSPHTGQASWAAAGMLAPLAECRARTPLLDLGLASLALWPRFADELREISGVDVAIEGPGMLRMTPPGGERAELEAEFRWQQTLGLPLEWISEEDVRQLEPALAGGRGPAILSPSEKHVPPRPLLLALATAAARAGVHLHTDSEVTGFETEGEQVKSVQTAARTFSCRQVVLASGCWSGELAKVLKFKLPVYPIFGQMIAFSRPSLLSHTVYTHQGYLVPRLDGELLSGATEEDMGFRNKLRSSAALRLKQFAQSILPSLDGPSLGSWGGLRPATRDKLPVLGPAPGWENVHVATGHFRNGILLTPITADLMTDAILHKESHPLLAGVSPARFE